MRNGGERDTVTQRRGENSGSEPVYYISFEIRVKRIGRTKGLL